MWWTVEDREGRRRGGGGGKEGRAIREHLLPLAADEPI
jgi:hypothetical protein